jgi:hypothetical protein
MIRGISLWLAVLVRRYHGEYSLLFQGKTVKKKGRHAFEHGGVPLVKEKKKNVQKSLSVYLQIVHVHTLTITDHGGKLALALRAREC